MLWVMSLHHVSTMSEQNYENEGYTWLNFRSSVGDPVLATASLPISKENLLYCLQYHIKTGFCHSNVEQFVKGHNIRQCIVSYIRTSSR